MELDQHFYPKDRERMEKVYDCHRERHITAVKRKLEKASMKYDPKKMKLEDVIEEASDASDLFPDIGQIAYAVPHIALQNTTSKNPTNGTDEVYGVVQMSQKDSDVRGAEGHLRVEEALRRLNYSFEKQKAKCMFLISDYAYENILRHCQDTTAVNRDCIFRKRHGTFLDLVKSQKSLFTLPPDCQRGNCDLIVLHEKKGILLIQVKSVKPSNNTDEAATKEKIEKGIKQLEKDEQVVKKFYGRISKSLTKVLALPNIKRESCATRPAAKYLFEDDLRDDDTLQTWWDGLEKKSVDIKDIQKIVGRFVGILSTPVEQLVANEHHCVKEFADVILFTGRLFKRLQLTGEQMELLNNWQEKDRMLYLSGPPGSGKTLMLIQAARSFAKQSRSHVVVVLNLYRGKAGRPVGDFIFNTLTREKSIKHQIKHLAQDVNNQTECDTRFKKVVRDIQEKNVMFVIDEAFSCQYLKKFCEKQQKSFLWSAGIDPDLFDKQPDMTKKTLTTVLRCPPSVQKVLRQVDWNTERKDCYASDTIRAAAERGTAGPIPACIRHESHGEPPSLVINCRRCACELAQLLDKNLRLIYPNSGSSSSRGHSVTLPCSVAILCSISRECYERTRVGGHEVEISKAKCTEYIKNLSKSSFIQTLKKELGDKVKVCIVDIFVNDLKECWDSILVTWVDAFQGLERDVIVFLPGDVGNVERSSFRELPVPGARDASTLRRSKLLEHKEDKRSLTKMMFEETDIERFSSWDKTNLFMAASRCSSQLIMVVP